MSARERNMAVKLSHIIIPVKSAEEMKKAAAFFVDVIGLHLRDGMPDEGLATGTDVWTKYGQRFPDRILHLMDDYDTFVDIVFYDNKPVCFARGIGSGKGPALAFRVPDIRQAWDKLKDYPVQPVYDPCRYPEEGGLLSGHSEPWLGEYLAFCAVNIGRVSEDGEEQVIELCEMKKNG
jgi:catechol 2,3-dioxygenase-like lactoylglutathione lyase family enzyme